MTHETILVTASDEKYFALLQSTIRSIRDKPQGTSQPIGFFDLGCTGEQRSWLESQRVSICEPRWSYEFPSRDQKPSYLKGLLARPHLRNYLPGYEVYLWLDADAWVQDWSAIDLFVQGARRRQGLAIVPEVDRCSLRQYGGLPAYWGQAFGWYKNAFDEAIAHKLCNMPMLNAGVYAMHTNAPHWEIWDRTIAAVLMNICNVMTDQLALNHTVYLGGCMQQTELLPACCNWVCHNGFPRWQRPTGTFVENYLPHKEIGIMHLTTRDKSMIRRIQTTDDELVDIRLSYPPEILSNPTGESH